MDQGLTQSDVRHERVAGEGDWFVGACGRGGVGVSRSGESLAGGGGGAVRDGRLVPKPLEQTARKALLALAEGEVEAGSLPDEHGRLLRLRLGRQHCWRPGPFGFGGEGRAGDVRWEGEQQQQQQAQAAVRQRRLAGPLLRT